MASKLLTISLGLGDYVTDGDRLLMVLGYDNDGGLHCEDASTGFSHEFSLGDAAKLTLVRTCAAEGI